MATESAPPTGASEKPIPVAGELVTASPPAPETIAGAIAGAMPLVQHLTEHDHREKTAQREHERALRRDAYKFAKPLVYGVGAVVCAIALWASFTGRWDITTHLLAVAVGWVGAKGVQK